MKKIIFMILLVFLSGVCYAADTWELINGKSFVYQNSGNPIAMEFTGYSPAKKDGIVFLSWFEWLDRTRQIGADMSDAYKYRVIGEVISIETLEFVLTASGSLVSICEGSIFIDPVAEENADDTITENNP
jgi:hypothetical protein